MFRLAVVSCVIVAALAFDVALDSEWEAFKVTYNKQYHVQNYDNLRYVDLNISTTLYVYQAIVVTSFLIWRHGTIEKHLY